MQVQRQIELNRQFQNQRGVTLIEAIMVITLLAAASAAGLILFDGQWTARRAVGAVTCDVLNSLKSARNTSIGNQCIVRVRRDNGSGGTKLLISEQAGPYRDARTWSFDLGEDVRLLGRPVEFQFRPDGTANRNVRWRIVQSGVSGQVDVHPASGLVTMIKP